MMIFDRKAGAMTFPDGKVYHNVWSGYGNAHNDPACEKEHGVGPIPAGIYRLGHPYLHPVLGRFVMNLDPEPGTDTFGRSAFRWHGDNSTPAPYDASHGCIVSAPALRELGDKQTDRRVEVV